MNDGARSLAQSSRRVILLAEFDFYVYVGDGVLCRVALSFSLEIQFIGDLLSV